MKTILVDIDENCQVKEIHSPIEKLKNQEQADYEKDMELMGKQHTMAHLLKCQLGCGNYATERVTDYTEDAKEIQLLVCESCLWSQYEQNFDFESDKGKEND